MSDIKEENNVLLRQKKVELTRIVEAINFLSKNKDWSTLKELLFDNLVDKLGKLQLQEANKDQLNDPQLYRLQGELKWAKRYSDLYKLAEAYKIELNNITKKLNENAII